MRYELPINYGKEDIKRFFTGIGAEKSYTENASNKQMNDLLSLIWHRRSSAEWSDIPAEYKRIR